MRFVLCLFLVVAVLAVPAWPAEGGANAVFLVAKREMRDRNFAGTVVLVTHPPRGGPIGVILNRPLDEPLSRVLPDLPALKGRKEVLYFGGPIARDGLVFLVRSADPPEGVLMILRDAFFTSDVDLIDARFQRNDPLRGLRIFGGYSGWAPGQLQREIMRGDWFVLPADSETVFDKDPARVWRELIERASARQASIDDSGIRKDDLFLTTALQGSPFINQPSSFRLRVVHHAPRGYGARQ